MKRTQATAKSRIKTGAMMLRSMLVKKIPVQFIPQLFRTPPNSYLLFSRLEVTVRWAGQEAIKGGVAAGGVIPVGPVLPPVPIIGGSVITFGGIMTAEMLSGQKSSSVTASGWKFSHSR